MFEHLLKIRFVAVVVVIFALMHALAFMFLGVQAAVKTYAHILTGTSAGSDQQPALHLLHALDFMLVSLVMIILAVGVARLFLLPHHEGDNQSLPRWLKIETFSDLKLLLWETILLALLVVGLSTLIPHFQPLSWTALVIPAAILLLALSLFFMRRAA